MGIKLEGQTIGNLQAPPRRAGMLNEDCRCAEEGAGFVKYDKGCYRQSSVTRTVFWLRVVAVSATCSRGHSGWKLLAIRRAHERGGSSVGCNTTSHLLLLESCAFIAYVAVVDRGISIGTLPGAEITLFTTAFQAFTYLVLMAVANVSYLAGPISESIVKPKNIERYRHVTYWFGFCFSVLLPFFTIPCFSWSYIIHPGTAVMPEP